MLAWHFLKANRKLNYKDGREVVDGEELEMLSVESNQRDGGQITAPVLCVSGMHASVKLRDALNYAPGLVLCRVDVTDDVVSGDDKITGRRRRVLWSIPEDRMRDLVVRYARWCADRAEEHSSAARSAAYAAYAADSDARSAAYAAYSAARSAADAASAAYAADSAAYAARSAARSAASAAYSAEELLQEEWLLAEVEKLRAPCSSP